jgi:RimJ/RimL family protein N-acetyltransferase
MFSSAPLVDEELLLRPFRLGDSTGLYCAVKESLRELKPWMSWATDHYSELTAREYITITRARWEEHTFYAFAITRADEILGGCTLSSIHPIYLQPGLLGAHLLSWLWHCRTRCKACSALCL